MHILLPPSETKRSGGGNAFQLDSLAHDETLQQARIRVRDALVKLSGDADAAVKVLKLGVKNQDERLHNLALGTSGVMPAIDRYTGVLYDALDAASLDARSRAWLSAHVSIQSALLGLLSAGDEIPAYRLSGSSRLPALEAPLKRVWASAHEGIDWSGLGWILDLRSKDYVALAPLPRGVGSWLNVVQRGPSGEVRALNHFNKAAKGDLVRRLAMSGAQIEDSAALLQWAENEGLELLEGQTQNELTLVTDLVAGASKAR